MKVKIIFDKDRMDDRFETGWGISYLIGNTLFDTGEKFEYLINNMKILNIDIKTIENIVISHNHWDHRRGLWQLLETKTDIKVYSCRDLIEEFKDKINKYNFIEVKDFQEIDKGIYSSGCLRAVYKGIDLFEQVLIVKTDKGISIICACAHLGVLKIIQKVKECFPGEKLYCIFGGFHLMDTDMRMIKYTVDEIKKIGVEKIGSAHCTGYEATEIFKESYKDNFLDIKAGKEFEI
ncbi:MAG: MBL fold metallo-hydrolase [Candidatus Omnitrophota bacterium]|nr:MBL fold metallo-hydrolase [Candidatus Omnitrophota bacterium]